VAQSDAGAAAENDDGGDGDDDRPAAVIVLLSDGTPTVPSDGFDDGAAVRWLEQASEAAVDAGVPVSTVAFGTADGVVEIDDPENPGTTIRVDVPVDEATLEAVAETTGGSFFTTASADELTEVYRDIGTTVGFETLDRDITDWFVMIALALALLTGVLSLLWFQRLP
jgi:Ca-activated chloride channel family protein